MAHKAPKKLIPVKNKVKPCPVMRSCRVKIAKRKKAAIFSELKLVAACFGLTLHIYPHTSHYLHATYTLQVSGTPDLVDDYIADVADWLGLA